MIRYTCQNYIGKWNKCILQMGEKKYISFDMACTARGEAATKRVGSGFDGSEPAPRWKGIK